LAYSPTTNGFGGALEGLLAEGAWGTGAASPVCARAIPVSARAIVRVHVILAKDFKQGSCIRILRTFKLFLLRA
jgi:hypothetical protein